jgi:uncharacterized protein YggE
MKFRLVAVLWAMPMMLMLNASAFAQATSPAPKTIDVTGHGESSAKPDLMTLSFAVTSHSESADECTRNESETSRRVVDVLKATLGESAKIITSDFSFYPSTEYGNGLATPTPIVMGGGAATPAEPPAIWQFKGQVDAFSDSMEPIADLIETGMAAGATSVADSGVAQVPEDWDPTAPAISRPSGSSATGTGAYRRIRRMYRVGLSVEVQGVSAADAMRKGNLAMSRVETALRDKMGGQGKVDVDDFGVNQINPQQQATAPRYQPYVQQPQRKVYDARMTVSAETQKLDLLGPSVEAATKAGAAQLNQVTFTLKDDSAARKDAIEKASADAKSKAETLAASMGVKLKGILRISTNAQARPYVLSGSQYEGAVAQMSTIHRAAGSVAAPQIAQIPVAPRDVGFGADVSVTYQIE